MKLTHAIVVTLVTVLATFSACQKPIENNPMGHDMVDEGGGVGNGLKAPVLLAVRMNATALKVGDVLRTEVQAVADGGKIETVTLSLASLTKPDKIHNLVLQPTTDGTTFFQEIQIESFSFSDGIYAPVDVRIADSHSLAAQYVYLPDQSSDFFYQVDSPQSVTRTAISVPRVFVDTGNPFVKISSPAASARVSGTVAIMADAADYSKIKKLDLFVQDHLISTAMDQPNLSFNFDTTTLFDGPATIRAEATDEYGNIGVTQIQVIVDNIPALQLASPEILAGAAQPYSFLIAGDIRSTAKYLSSFTAIHWDGRISYNQVITTTGRPRATFSHFLALNDAAHSNIVIPGIQSNRPPTATLFDYDSDGYADLIVSTYNAGRMLLLYRADPTTTSPRLYFPPVLLSLADNNLADCGLFDVMSARDWHNVYRLVFTCATTNGLRFIFREPQNGVLSEPIVKFEGVVPGRPIWWNSADEFLLSDSAGNVYHMNKTGPLLSDFETHTETAFPKGGFGAPFYSCDPIFARYDTSVRQILVNQANRNTTSDPWVMGQTIAPTIDAGAPFSYTLGASIVPTKARMELPGKLAIFHLRKIAVEDIGGNGNWHYEFQLSKVGVFVDTTPLSLTSPNSIPYGDLLDLTVNGQPFFDLNESRYSLVDAVDMNRDGKLELVLTKGKKSFMFERIEFTNSWVGQEINLAQALFIWGNSYYDPTSEYYLVDMNSDGLLDVVSCSYSQIQLRLNSGTNTQMVLAPSTVHIPLSNPSDCSHLAFMDVDYDDALDILIGRQQFQVIENTGTSHSPTFSKPLTQLLAGGSPVDIRNYAVPVSNLDTGWIIGFPVVSGTHQHPELFILDSYTRLLKLANLTK